jgi:hypothetical protein
MSVIVVPEGFLHFSHECHHFDTGDADDDDDDDDDDDNDDDEDDEFVCPTINTSNVSSHATEFPCWFSAVIVLSSSVSDMSSPDWTTS